jgi:hypothetical protein
MNRSLRRAVSLLALAFAAGHVTHAQEAHAQEEGAGGSPAEAGEAAPSEPATAAPSPPTVPEPQPPAAPKAEPAPPPAPPANSASAPTEPPYSIALPIVVGVIGLGGIAAGIALTVVSNDKQQTADDLLAALQADGLEASCSTSAADPRCAERSDALEAEEDLSDAALGTLIGGLAVTVVGVGLGLAWAAFGPDGQALVVTPGIGGVSLRARF